MWALTLLLHIAQSIRWVWHIVVVFTMSLWLPCCCLYITMSVPSCCAGIIVLLDCCVSYDAHISNVRRAFSVCILSFLQYLVYFGVILVAESCVAFSTIIFRSYRAWRQASCVGYYNIMYALFLARTIQQKHSAPISLCSKLAKIVSTLRCFYHISKMLQPE